MKKFKSGKEFKESLGKDEVTALCYANWCPFCRAFLPKFEEKFGKSGRHLMVAIDEDEDPLWDECKIKAVPTVLVFKGKKVAKRFDAIPGVGLNINDIK